MPKASVYFTLRNTDSKHDIKEIKQGLDALPGVSSVSFSNDSNRVAVDFDTTGIQPGRIEKQLEKMGCEILDSKYDDNMM